MVIIWRQTKENIEKEKMIETAKSKNGNSNNRAQQQVTKTAETDSTREWN